MNNFRLNSLNVISFLNKNDFKGSVVSTDRIRELKTRVESLRSDKLLDETFFQERLNIFDFDISRVMTNAKSIIVTTKRQPIVRVDFHYRGTKHKVIVPPTYSNSTDKQAFELLNVIFEKGGYILTEIQLPEKLLLVMSGVGKYGRNNIAYIDGAGSFHRPTAFITDAKLDEISWREPALHERCIKCKACINACPCNVISEDRFLVQAEKCLTYFNERNYPFPGWLNPEWHNSIIGCMICQNICPLNREYLDNIESTTEFSELETLQILNNIQITNLSQSTITKLKDICLFDDYNLLSRNLSALLNRAN